MKQINMGFQAHAWLNFEKSLRNEISKQNCCTFTGKI